MANSDENSNPHGKRNTRILFAVLGGVITALGLLVFVIWLIVGGAGPADHDSAFRDGDPIVCTMDAKECPDGSFVGRVPPVCEFAPCPGE